MKKKILFITHAGEPGGAEFKLIDLCESIEHEREVLLFQHGSLERILGEHGIAHSVIPMAPATGAVRREGGLSGLLRAVPGTLAMARAVARKARAFDVVVCFSQKSFVVTALAKPFMRRPVCWFMNDILSTEHFNPLLVRALLTLARRGADYVVLNSHASLDAWLAAGGRRARVAVVHPMTRSDAVAAQTRDANKVAFYRHYLSPQGRPLIGMFGRISPWKGQDVFLHAIARLPGVNAVIAGGALFGEERYEASMRALAAQLGIAGRVNFAGHVEEVAAMMAACNVVAHCSTAPEPFGRVIVESMFAGTPVIATDAGGAREIVQHDETGQLTPMRDVQALVTAIRRYLDAPEWSRALAQRARAHAEEKFSAAAMTSRFSQILATL
jgi:glycosyltransferase involved in cell wall biosynthesis